MLRATSSFRCHAGQGDVQCYLMDFSDSLGKFDGKVDEGFLVGYSISSKAFRVFNSRTRIVQETLHVNFLEKKPNVASSGPTRLFDIDTLTKTMNYQPVTTDNQSNPSAGVQEQFDAGKAREGIVQQYVLFLVWSSSSKNPQNTDGDVAFDEKEPEFDEKKPDSIKYALTVNPNIYVSCIKQFWTSVAVKKVNDITRLQALVDKKRVIITEAIIRDALHLDDAEGDLSSHTIKYSSPALTHKVFVNMRRVGKGFSKEETPLFKGMIVEQQVGEGVDGVHIDDVSAVGVAAEEAASVADDEVHVAVNEPSIPSPPPPTPPPPP
nr:retrovirus-related Pol polyprotein from transposon TNT 1-94 [Tanacetum cinerariifolium]